MKSVIAVSAFFISILQVINGGFVNDDWHLEDFGAPLEVRGPLKDTGYWNFLAIGGLYGRMLHFLVTDSDAFGSDVEHIKLMLKKQYGDEYYTNLESHAAESFPIAQTIYKSMNMITKVLDVRDRKTQKTLGEALYILQNIADDRDAVMTVVDRWHMVKDISSIFKNPDERQVDDAQVTKLKILLLERPEVFQKLVAEPEVLSRLSGYVLESLKDIDLAKAIQSAQEAALLLSVLYPRNYQELAEELLQIRDEQTGLSFAEGLRTVSNVIKTDAFQGKLQKLLDTDVLQRVHDASQQPTIEAARKRDPKAALDQANPDEIRLYLEAQGIYMSDEKVKQLLDDARNNRLISNLLGVLTKAEDENGNLTPERVSKRFAEVNIRVPPKKVTRIMQLLQTFAPEMIVSVLKSMGINAKFVDIEKLVERSRQAAPLETEGQAPVTNESQDAENTGKPAAGIPEAEAAEVVGPVAEESEPEILEPQAADPELLES